MFHDVAPPTLREQRDELRSDQEESWVGAGAFSQLDGVDLRQQTPSPVVAEAVTLVRTLTPTGIFGESRACLPVACWPAHLVSKQEGHQT